jgi:hypothetical protein
MKSAARTVQLVLGVTEKRAKWCKISGRSHASPTLTELRYRNGDRRRLLTSRSPWILGFLLGLPAALCAQNPQEQWSNLNRLKAGQGIEVIESNLKSHKGRFVTVTDELLSLQEKGADVSIKREDIVRVSTSSAPKRGEHAVIGLVVGGAIGAGIGALVTSRSTSSGGFGWRPEQGVGALVGVAIFAPGGALFGALIPAHTTMYRAEPHTKSPPKQD